MSNLVQVIVPGDIARTSRGMVRSSTMKRLVRLAREQRADLAQAAAVELIYPTKIDQIKQSLVIFDKDKPSIYGF